MAYTYDRTAASDSVLSRSVRGIVKKNRSATLAVEKEISKAISTLARIPGMGSVTDALDEAADTLKKASDLLQTAYDRLESE